MPYVQNLHYNTVLPFTARSNKWVFPTRFSTEALHKFHVSPISDTSSVLFGFDLLTYDSSE